MTKNGDNEGQFSKLNKITATQIVKAPITPVISSIPVDPPDDNRYMKIPTNFTIFTKTVVLLLNRGSQRHAIPTNFVRVP